MIRTDYALTPETADKLRDAELAAERANVVHLLDGDGMMYTTLGHNMQAHLAGAAARRDHRADHGALSLAALPFTSGMRVRLPRTPLRINGELCILEGPDGDGGQTFDLTPLGDGRYALVMETWLSLVGPSTLGKAIRPAGYAGVQDRVNKPGADALYPAGNVDRASEAGVSDAPFVTATLQTQKMVQRQYRLRLVQDRDLTGYRGVDDMVYSPDTGAYAPHGVEFVVPHETLAAYDRAYDRRLLILKLCVVERAGSELRLHVNNPMQPSALAPLGQVPVPFVPLPRRTLEILRGEVVRLDASDAALGARLDTLELRQMYADLRNPLAQTILRAEQSAGEQRVAFTQSASDAPGWHDPEVYPSRCVVNFTGRVAVTATAAFPGGTGSRQLRLLKKGSVEARVSGSGADDVHLCLHDELNVQSGDVLELSAWQTSETSLNLLPGARLIVRRVE